MRSSTFFILSSVAQYPHAIDTPKKYGVVLDHLYNLDVTLWVLELHANLTIMACGKGHPHLQQLNNVVVCAQTSQLAHIVTSAAQYCCKSRRRGCGWYAMVRDTLYYFEDTPEEICSRWTNTLIFPLDKHSASRGQISR